MSEEVTPPQPAASESEPDYPPQARGRSIAFVLIFMSIVLLLLMGYRYNTETVYNDWYLFQVARHTAASLSLIGDTTELEYGREKMGDPRKLRAQLAVWKRGEDVVAPEDYLAASGEPLTPWESWSYRALDMRLSKAPGEHGPRVQFILKRGLSIEVRELDERIRMLEASGEGTPEELASLRAQLKDMRQTLHAHRTDPDAEHRNPTYMFYFIVVSECGAIEVMAIFLAAIIAFPTRLWKKLLGILLGLPVMYAVNIFRLTCLAVIGALDTQHKYFNFAHEYVWQAIYIIFVVAVWLLWVEYVVRGRWRKGTGSDEPTKGAGNHVQA